ncbi:MAG: hypothetical protein LIO99_08960 [Clostridiales bacterium]|nr:hypothetical protein [Clostridiales bacterium]
MVAPIVITVLVVAYYIIYFGALIYLLDGAWAVLLGLVPIALAATMIYVCVQRIKEIRSGEEDDLGKY